MSIICIRIKNHFHINGFPLSLALRQRLGATRKLPVFLKNLVPRLTLPVARVSTGEEFLFSINFVNAFSFVRTSPSVDLFSLYVLFSQYRSGDNTLGNRFFQISSYSFAYLCIIYEKTMGQVPLGPLLGKQNIQAKEVYWATLGRGVNVMGHPFLCYLEKVNTLEIVGKIFWKRRSGDIFLHVTTSFF